MARSGFVWNERRPLATWTTLVVLVDAVAWVGCGWSGVSHAVCPQEYSVHHSNRGCVRGVQECDPLIRMTRLGISTEKFESVSKARPRVKTSLKRALCPTKKEAVYRAATRSTGHSNAGLWAPDSTVVGVLMRPQASELRTQCANDRPFVPFLK